MTPEEIIKVLREVDADAKASEGDYYADQFAWHGAGEVADAVEQMAAEIARLREERRQREKVWLMCAEETRLVYGNCFMPKPLPPGPEANG